MTWFICVVYVVLGDDNPDLSNELPASDNNDPQFNAATATVGFQDERPATRHRVITTRRHRVITASSPHSDGVHCDVSVLRSCRRPRAGRLVSWPTSVQAAICYSDVLDSAQTVLVRGVFAAEGLALQVDSGDSACSGKSVRKASW